MTHIEILRLPRDRALAGLHVRFIREGAGVVLAMYEQGETFDLARGITLDEDMRLMFILAGLIAGKAWNGWARFQLFEDGEEWERKLKYAAARAHELVHGKQLAEERGPE